MSDIQNPRPGVQSIADGAEHRPRGARTGELAMSQAHGQALEPLRSGNVFTVSTPLTGITVTANMLVSVASSNAILGLYNPNAGVAAHITRLVLCIASNATLTTFLWGYNTPTQLATTPAGTNAVRHSTLQSGGHLMKAFNGAQAVSGAAVTIPWRPIATCPVGTVNVIEADCDILVPPYGFAGVYAELVTATPVRGGLTWEEVPWP